MAGLGDNQLVMLCGAGSTWKLVEPVRRALGGTLIAPDWIEPIDRTEPLESYARRWLASFRDELDPSRPVYLAGMSMGGVVAQAMAQMLPWRGIFLISSTRTRRALPALLRAAAAAESVLPAKLDRMMLPLGVRVGALFERLNRHERKMLLESLLEGSVRARQWSERMFLRAEFEGRLDGVDVPVHSIHGDLDQIFLLKRVQADHVVRGGRHLITLTHGEEVARFLLERMSAA